LRNFASVRHGREWACINKAIAKRESRYAALSSFGMCGSKLLIYPRNINAQFRDTTYTKLIL
jgi:hypothetical protein